MIIPPSLPLCLLILASLLAPGKTLAEFSLGVGGGVETSAYRGYSTQWTPLPILSYEGDLLYIREMGAGIKALDLAFLEVSAYAAYNDLRFEHQKSSDQQLKLLNNRDASIVGGIGTRLKTPAGMFQLAAAVDLMHNSKGFTGEAGYVYSFEFGDLELLPAIGVYWSDAQYTTYYYGVSIKESHLSGLAPYAPGHSFSPYIGLTLSLTLDESWEVFLHGQARQLDQQITDSPMVDSSRTYSASMGFVFTF